MTVGGESLLQRILIGASEAGNMRVHAPRPPATIGNGLRSADVLSNCFLGQRRAERLFHIYAVAYTFTCLVRRLFFRT